MGRLDPLLSRGLPGRARALCRTHNGRQGPLTQMKGLARGRGARLEVEVVAFGGYGDGWVGAEPGG
jgi:hypothetical protein